MCKCSLSYKFAKTRRSPIPTKHRLVCDSIYQFVAGNNVPELIVATDLDTKKIYICPYQMKSEALKLVFLILFALLATSIQLDTIKANYLDCAVEVLIEMEPVVCLKNLVQELG